MKVSTLNPGTSQPPSPLQLPQASPQSSQTLELQVCPELPSFASVSDASISTAIDMNNVGSPVLTASGRPGVGQANNVNSNITITHANGGPLSYFLSNDTDTTINCREENVVLGSNNSFSSNPYPDPDQREPELSSLSPNPSFELSHTSTKELNHASKTETSSSIKGEDPEAQIDIGDVDYHPYRHLHTQTPEAEERIESKCQPSAPDQEDNKPSIEIDWDSDETWQRRLFRTIMDERRRREEEERRIQYLRQELEEERQNLAQIMYNIDQQKKALEVKLFEVEDLIPCAKYLKDIGIGFDQAIVWIDCIKQKAEIERIDLRTATWKLAQDLRAYRDLGGLSKAIQDATQQLAMLNMVNERQKRAIATLVDLQPESVGRSTVLPAHHQIVGHPNTHLCTGSCKAGTCDSQGFCIDDGCGSVIRGFLGFYCSPC